MTRDSYDVVIAGYGPVGEVLANLLGRDGHRVAAFERADSVYHMPRAAHFDHEAMRVFQSVGLAEAILPSTCWIRGMHFLNGDRQKLFGFEQPIGATANGWNNDYMFYQPTLELALREGGARFSNVDVFLGHEVESVRDTGDHTEVVVRDLDGDHSRTIDAKYVVGCDGARSTTRRVAGIERDDLGFDESWLVIDVRLLEELDLPDVCHQICDPARPTTYVPMPEPYRRWEFMLLPGEAIPDMEQHTRVYELLEPWARRDQVEIVRAVVYTFHAVIARGWRQGRVLIAGDAAHLMPPFLGQGMCSGIRDASNLAWKLDLVLRGLASDDVLDTYEPERAPHVRSIIDAAVTFGGMICTLDAEIAAQRDAHFFGNPEAFPGDTTTALLPTLGPGVVAVDDAGAAGRLFIQPWVTTPKGDEVLLDDATGPGFVLLSRADTPPIPDAGARSFARLGGRTFVIGPDGDLVDRDGFLDEWFEEHGVDVVLLRPDRYVFGTATSVAGATALVDELVAALA